MQEEGSFESAKNGVVTEVIKAAVSDPKIKEAAGNLGQTAVTLTKTINNVLVPLAAINFAFDKARIYFAERFQHDIAEKAEGIPSEHIIEPKASIAGPTLQGLAFTHEEPNLKDMYLSLLATAMDGRSASVVHPAFVEIIKQLDSEDARLIRAVIQGPTVFPIVQIRRKLAGGTGYNVLAQHLLNLSKGDSKQPAEDSRIPAMIDNWIRLGLVEVRYDTFLTGDGFYSWVERRPEFLRFSQEVQSSGAVIDYEKGMMQRTELGKRFAQAIGVQIS
jgi:hypothetical protein